MPILPLPPSPLQRVAAFQDISVFLKRDDMLHPEIEGSKIRKIALAIPKVQASFPKGIVTPGGAFSNHLHAVAASGRLFGFATTGLIRGEHVDLQNPTLQYCMENGMKLLTMPKAGFDALLLSPEDWMETHFPGAYFLPQGGNTPEAVEACSAISVEIREQLQALEPGGFSRIYCCVPAGTGCTAAGVIRGMSGTDMETIVFPVSAQGIDNDSISRMIGAQAEAKTFRIEMDYILGGFARFHAGAMHFARRFWEENGVLLDPIYTAKMAFGVFEMLGKGYFQPGSAVVLLHTGGMQGWRGFVQRYKQQLIEQQLGALCDLGDC